MTNVPRIDLQQHGATQFLDGCMRDYVPALLFTGPDGVGKELTAVDFARRLTCTRDVPCSLADELCESCRMALRFEHPSITLVYPTPTQGGGEKEGDDEVDIGKILEEKRKDIFNVFRFSKKASIRIARSRAIIQRASSKPFGGGRNIFIIVDAHTMREEAQNALLKLIEEPPERCVLILIAPSPDAILYTIRSRCQRVRFGPLKPDVIEKVLTEHYGVKEAASRKAASLARGSMRRALEIAAQHDDDEREAAYDVLDRIPTAPRSWLVHHALTLSRSGNRDGLARFLHELAVACRDVMAGDEALHINKDRSSFFDAQRDKWNSRRLPQVIGRILETRDGILRRNLNTDAALVDLFLEIRRIGC